LIFLYAVCNHENMDIKQIIADCGLTRAEICQRAGITRGFLSMLESGTRSVGTDRIAAVAMALGVTPAKLRPDLAALFADT